MSAHTVRPIHLNTASGTASGCTAWALKKSRTSNLCALS